MNEKNFGTQGVDAQGLGSKFLYGNIFTGFSNWRRSKVNFRANVKRYAITLARKWTFGGQQL